MDGRRRVTLRDEHDGGNSRSFTACLEANGDLRLSGQDLGPGTGPVSSDGEYEWETVVPAAHLPALLETLDAEQRLRSSGIPVDRWVYGG